MMKRRFGALPVVFAGVAACQTELAPAWQLDHDRIVAARATPPHIIAGEVAALDALIAHAGAPTTVESPIGATAAGAPGGLFVNVHFVFDHWEIQGATDADLAAARSELGLAADQPVPLEVTLVYKQGLVAKKVVWLGDSRPNPKLPAITIDGAAPPATLDVPGGRDIALEVDAADASWLSSCGTLDDDRDPVATLHVAPEDPQQGEFAIVVRDDVGGVVWHVWPIAAR